MTVEKENLRSYKKKMLSYAQPDDFFLRFSPRHLPGSIYSINETIVFNTSRTIKGSAHLKNLK
jgi:hypothetical protein